MVTRLYYRVDKNYVAQGTHRWGGKPAAGPSPFIRGLSTVKQDPVTISPAFYNYEQDASGDVLYGSYLTAPLTAQTISGTVKGQALVAENISSANLTSQMRIYLVDGVTAAIKSTLYGGYTGPLADEWTSSFRNRQMPQGGSVPLTTRTAVAGDRILVMVGARSITSASNYAFAFAPAARGEGDLPEDTSASAGDAWLQFSADLSFSADFEMNDFGVPEEYLAYHEDGIGDRVGDPRENWGEEDVAGGEVVAPDKLQIWPRGNRG